MRLLIKFLFSTFIITVICFFCGGGLEIIHYLRAYTLGPQRYNT
jgi:hypothetical protein